MLNKVLLSIFVPSFEETEAKYSQAKSFCTDPTITDFTDDICNVEGRLTSYSAALALYQDGYVAPKGHEVIRVAGRWDSKRSEWADDVADADCK